MKLKHNVTVPSAQRGSFTKHDANALTESGFAVVGRVATRRVGSWLVNVTSAGRWTAMRGSIVQQGKDIGPVEAALIACEYVRRQGG